MRAGDDATDARNLLRALRESLDGRRKAAAVATGLDLGRISRICGGTLHPPLELVAFALTGPEGQVLRDAIGDVCGADWIPREAADSLRQWLGDTRRGPRRVRPAADGAGQTEAG